MCCFDRHRRLAAMLAPLLALGGVAGAWAAPPAAPSIDGAQGLITSRFLHEDWRPEHGLPGRSVRALLQTRDGYLMIGTEGGLARFDGVAFKPLDLGPGAGPGPEAALAVRALLEDADGDLWMATPRGLLRRSGAALRRYTTADGLPEDLVSTLHEDARRRLWVGTEGGLAERRGDRFVHVPGLAQSVLGIASDYRGDLWVTNRKAFLLRDGALVPFPLDPADPSLEARAIGRDAAGRLYVATLTDLLRYDPPALPGQGPPSRRYTPRDGLPDRPITRILFDAAGRVWIGTSGGGLLLLAGERFERLGAREGLADDNVVALVADREGSVLVGTGGGLAILRARAALTHGEVMSPLWSVCGDEDGLWLGTQDGLLRLGGGQRGGPSRRRYGTAEGLPSGEVLSCLRTADGRVIAGTRAGAVQLKDGRLAPLSPPVSGAGILAMHEDREGALWLATVDSLLRVHGGALVRYTRREGLPEGPIRVIRDAPGGGLLIGGKSLARLEPGRSGAALRGDGEYLSPLMDAVVDEERGEVWLASYGRGLHLLRGGRYFHFESAAPELGGALMRILDDGRGAFWISSDDGLLRVEKAALRDLADGRRATAPVRRYDKLDGLLSTDFNASGQSSGWRGPDGRLWFPSSGGLLEIDPERVPRNGTAPIAHIDRVRVDGVELPGDGAVVLPAGAGRVSIHYTAPSLRGPRRLRFRYRLEGVDGGWIDAGHRRVAHYTGLAPGPYRFLVQAQNEDGVWSAEPATLALRMPPSLLRRPWFWLLCLGCAAALLLGLGRLQERRHQARARRLQRLVDQRTEALQREIGERLRAQEALGRSRDELEERVSQRTAQLVAELGERSRLEGELLQSRKLEAVGRLAGGVAHDLNNMLTAIIGCADFACEAATDEGQREDIAGIREAAGRAAQLTGRLLVFAGRHAVAPRSFDVNALVLETSKLLRRALGEHVAIDLALQASLHPVWADPHQIEQVLVNLSINGRDAMPGGGTLRIETREGPGDGILVCVTDEGSGMTEEVRRHLFEPFFTTKAPGRGTGLGLATCYGIVSQSGGHIEIESEVGRGTAVRVSLPRAMVAAQPPVRAEEGPPPRGSETVLLVEDMAEVREVTARALRGLGYRVVEAASGEEALDLVAESFPDVVVTDVVMPGMGGPEMATRLRAQRPDLRVLFTSGHLDRALSQQGVLDESVALLRKPFTPAALARRLRDLITAPGRSA